MQDTIAALALGLVELRRSKDDVGRMPPVPPTQRGRIGAVLVRVVRRALFWIWPPFHSLFDVLCRMLECLARGMTELDARVRSLESQQGAPDRVEVELADIRDHRDRMDEAQAELWLEIKKLKAQLAEIRSNGLDPKFRTVEMDRWDA